jgi:hypothetical protein
MLLDALFRAKVERTIRARCHFAIGGFYVSVGTAFAAFPD